MRLRPLPLGTYALLLALLPVAWGCQPSTPSATPPASVAAVPDSLRSDSLTAALAPFTTDRSPSATDSATLRRWADSLEDKGSALRNQAPVRARAYLRQAKHAYRQVGDSIRMAGTIPDIGFTYRYQSRYKEAMHHHRRALSLYRQFGNQEWIANALTHIGILRDDQGQYQKAFLRFREALQINRRLNDPEDTARSLNSLGIVRWRQGQYENAIAHFEEALATYRSMGDQAATAALLNNIGVIRRDQGKLEQALDQFRESLRMKREIGDRESVARTLNNIGSVHDKLDRPERALARYRRALRIERKIGDQKGIAENLNDIGAAHLHAGRLRAATDTLRRAAGLVETLRLNATSPEARRSLLSTQIGTYRALTTAHVRAGRPDAALQALERARARLLADHLAGTARGDTTFAIPHPADLRKRVGSQEAVLLYANAGTQWPLTVLVATRDSVHARELPDATIRARIGRAYADSLRRLRRNEGPLTAALGNSRSPDQSDGTSLSAIVQLYRHYLVRDGIQPTQNDLARRLHELFVAPITEALEPAETVTVVPTGVLGYLPFETLRNSTGQYLVETRQVRYAQSLTVLQQLQGRHYPTSRRPLLALGGAAYTAPSPDEKQLLIAEARSAPESQPPTRGAALQRAIERQREQGQSPHSIYAQLGYGRWPSLYGTKLEVDKLARTVGAEATVLTGREASEPRVRQMSQSGQLARYRRLHFATHGLTVPQTPELSALVLSQTGASDSLAARDGYLTMREIATLDMRADVAVLSACRTGLGRIVAGAGVVNLSHAFLRAGANATLVSQWRVLDWSTQQFMTAVYRAAAKESTSFVEAVTQVKREFIAGRFGERNTDPLRWAPFVYYGRE